MALSKGDHLKSKRSQEAEAFKIIKMNSSLEAGNIFKSSDLSADTFFIKFQNIE